VAREIELKARVDDYRLLMDRINAVEGISPPLAEHKADIYLSRPGEKKHFRVRLQGAYVIITSKTKEKRHDGTEDNHEIEFGTNAGSYPQVLAFFYSLGFMEYIRKEKTGWLWSLGRIALELVQVGPLGWFVEMEIVLGDDASDAEVLQAKSELFELIGKLGIAKEMLEDRYYMDLLREQV